MSIGVLGGTFDPVHKAHLAVAEEARTRLNLDEVIFVPAGQPRLKENSFISPARHRVQMVRLAIAGKPHFRLSAMEIERAGPSYTIDTVTALWNNLGRRDELFFILGWDSLAQFPEWRDASRLVELCRLVAAPRPGYPLPDLKKLEADVPGLARRVIVLEKPEIDVSASEIRDRVVGGLSISHLVPEPVADYIKKHKLYLEQ